MIRKDNKLLPEDFSAFDDLPVDLADRECARLAKSILVDVLKVIIGKINLRGLEICCQDWDYSGCGYEFRNAFECACWIYSGRACVEVPDDERVDIKCLSDELVENTVRWHVQEIEKRVLLVWYRQGFDSPDVQDFESVVDIPEKVLNDAGIEFVSKMLNRQMQVSADLVSRMIDEFKAEKEKARREFEYDGEDRYIELVLQEILEMRPGSKILRRAVDFVEGFFENTLGDDDDGFDFSICYRCNGESRSLDFFLSEDRLSIYSGGSVDTGCGHDSYGDEVWSIERYGHCDGFCDVLGVAEDLLACGAKIGDEVDMDSILKEVYSYFESTGQENVERYAWYGPYCVVVGVYVHDKLSVREILSVSDKLNDLLTAGLPGFQVMQLDKADRIRGQMRAMEWLPETKGRLTEEEKEAFAFCVYYYSCTRVYNEETGKVEVPVKDFESKDKIDALYDDFKNGGMHDELFKDKPAFAPTGRFGFELTNPVLCVSVPMEYEYLHRLVPKNGEIVNGNRVGSFHSERGLCDGWDLDVRSGESGEVIRVRIYICPYGDENSESAPASFVLLPRGRRW